MGELTAFVTVEVHRDALRGDLSREKQKQHDKHGEQRVKTGVLI